MKDIDKSKDQLIEELNQLRKKITKLESEIEKKEKAENQLEENEVIFQSFLEHSPVYIFFKDEQIKTLRLSRNFEQMLGIPIDKAIGKSMDELFPSELSKSMVEDDKRILSEGVPITVVEEFGDSFYETTKFPILINNKTRMLAGFTIDITQRKKTEDILNLTLFSINNIADSIFWIDESANFKFVNDTACRNLGYTKEELMTMNIFDVDPIFPKEKLAEHWEEIKKKGSVVIDTVHRTKSGKEISVEVTTNFVEYNGVQYNCAIARDISARKNMEEALKKSEWEYKSTLNELLVGVVVHAADTSILMSNPEAQRILGLTEEQMLGKKAIDPEWGFLHPDLTKADYKDYPVNKVISTQKPLYNYVLGVYKTDKQQYTWANINAIPIFDDLGKIEKVIINFIDITDRIQTEKELRESEARFRALHNASFGGITIHDKGIILECNQGLAEITGYSEKELIGMNGLLLIAESSRDLVMSNILSGYEKPYEAVGLRKNGQEYPIRLEARNIPYKGKMVRSTEFRDITSVKEAEKALRESEIRHRTLVSNISDVIVILDKEGITKYKSPNIKEHFGWDPAELIGKSGFYTVHKDDLEKVTEAFLDVQQNKSKTVRVEYRYACKDGSYRPVELTAVNLLDDPIIDGILANYKDITQRKDAEKAIIENQRLGAIGEMASAVAHDFNNSLQSIFGNLELALINKDIPNSVRQYLETVKTATIDAATRVQLLQRFGGKKQGDNNRKLIDVNKLLNDVIKQARPLWKDETEKVGLNISVEFKLNEIPNIAGNEAELRAVIYNIVRNNVEAMPDGGIITLETGTNDTGIFVRISDTGIGMSEEIKKRVFQPFFTTKGFEAGRGLGMSGAYSIIKEHKGDIYIKESAPGIGTVIEIVLPFSKENENIEQEKNSHEFKGSAKILWVDDEQSIREVVSAMLQELGHIGDVVESGEEAIRKLENSNYDLVITDIGMPAMNGWQLADIIKEKLEGKMKVAVVTGWGAEVEDEKKRQHNVTYVISKPIRFEQLKAFISEVMLLDR